MSVLCKEGLERFWSDIKTYFSGIFAPKNHASTASTYGLGTTSNYGHVKTINALTQSSHADGTALSAYQGYILNQMLANGGFAVRFKTGSITIPAGTPTNPTHVDLTLTSTDCPTGYNVWGVMCTLGNYLLPFIRPTDSHYTNVVTYSATRIQFENTAGAWNNYTYYIILFLHKE